MIIFYEGSDGQPRLTPRRQTENSEYALECIKWIHNIQTRVGREDNSAFLYTNYIGNVFTFEVAYFKDQVWKEQLFQGLGTVWVTQYKVRHNPRGWQLEKPGKDNCLIHVKHPHNQQTCAQANSFSQQVLCVFGGRELVWFLVQTLFFLACSNPVYLHQQLSPHLGSTSPSIA